MSTVLEDEPPDTSSARNARSKLVDVPAPVKVDVPPPVKTAARIKIVLEEDVGIPPTGLYISANGRPYLLMPGVEASVPLEVVGVLNDAVTSVPTIDPQTKRVVGYRSRLRFPYRRVSD
jgi:hypothetical protein